jgi:hypothetical protein
MADRVKVWLVLQGGGASQDARGTRESDEASATARSDGAASSLIAVAQHDRSGGDGAGLAQLRLTKSKLTAGQRVEAAQISGLRAPVRLSTAEKGQAAEAQAAGLRAAAERGAPFCEECEVARKALADAWREGVA